MAVHVAAVAVERPELRTVDAFLDALDAMPTADLVSIHPVRLRARRRTSASSCSAPRPATSDALVALREAMPEHKVGFQLLLADPESGASPDRPDPSDMGGGVRDDRAADRGHHRARPRAAGGRSRRAERLRAHRAHDRRHPLAARGRHPPGRPRAVLLQPAVQLPARRRRLAVLRLSRGRRRARGRRPARAAAAVVRLHRALGDDTRLRILKLLAGRDLYLTEIAQQLELSKPTIKHHLALLRAAGLVTVVESGNVVYYSLRRDRIEAASTDLGAVPRPLASACRRPEKPRRTTKR